MSVAPVAAPLHHGSGGTKRKRPPPKKRSRPKNRRDLSRARGRSSRGRGSFRNAREARRPYHARAQRPSKAPHTVRNPTGDETGCRSFTIHLPASRQFVPAACNLWLFARILRVLTCWFGSRRPGPTPVLRCVQKRARALPPAVRCRTPAIYADQRPGVAILLCIVVDSRSGGDCHAHARAGAFASAQKRLDRRDSSQGDNIPSNPSAAH